MNCPNCGVYVSPNDNFCPQCGSKVQSYRSIRCPRCGAMNNFSNKHCSECGTALRSVPQKENKSQTSLIVALAIVATICVAVVCFIIFMPPSKNSGNDDAIVKTTQTVSPVSPSEQTEITHPPAPTPVRTPQPTPAPAKATPAPAVHKDSSYKTYRDYDFSFSCPYPGRFRAVSPLSDFTRSCHVSDFDSGEIYICATYNKPTRSIDKIVDNFKSSHSYNSITFDERGSNYCSVLISDNNTYYYCYYNTSDGMIRGFEMNFPIQSYGVYLDYIFYMQAEISFY